LNGVTQAPVIPREKVCGPLPPVVAKLWDAGGFEWYEHADGSTTTSRPHTVIREDGSEYVTIETVHFQRVPDKFYADASKQQQPQGGANAR
jgi:hypothetical protein